MPFGSIAVAYRNLGLTECQPSARLALCIGVIVDCRLLIVMMREVSSEEKSSDHL